MSGFWSIVRRETAERRLLLLGALILGLLPFAAALLPGETGRELAGSRFELAFVVALLATGITALVLGASVIARDLAERRLSFYFARPLPAWAIWGGKVTAAATLSLTTGALVLLPTLLTRPQLVDGLPPARLIPWGLAAFLGILGLSHAVSLVLRARSFWLLLDLAAILALFLLVQAARTPLLQAGIRGFSWDILVRGQLALLAIASLAVLAAGARQVAVGRTDLRQSHKALSLTLWGLLLPAALLFLGFSRWVLDVEPRNLETIGQASAAPAGPWIALAGTARHRPGFMPVFLLDTSTGRAVRIDTQAYGAVGLVDLPLRFSRDGQRAAWLEPRPASAWRLMTLDLAGPASRPLATAVALDSIPKNWALSEDGHRLATVERGRLLVRRLPQGELLASVPLELKGPPPGLAFEDPDRVILEPACATPRRTTKNAFEDPDRVILEQQIPNGGQRLTLEISTRKLKRQDLASPETGPPSRRRLGRHTFWYEPGDPRVLVIGDSEARALRRVHLPAYFLRYGGQPAPDQLIFWSDGFPWLPNWRGVVWLLDFEEGTLRLLARGLRPVDLGCYTPVGAPASRLFFNRTELVRIDPETGSRTTLLRLS